MSQDNVGLTYTNALRLVTILKPHQALVSVPRKVGYYAYPIHAFRSVEHCPSH